MRGTRIAVVAMVVGMLAASAWAKVGDAAPEFAAVDQNGKMISLGNLKGSVIVLEWIGPGCPFVERHGKEGTMKNLAAKYKGQSVVWVGVITGAGGTMENAQKWAKKAGVEYPILLDADGKIGKAYGAKATPHLFVIDKAGTLAYAGAIDNDPDGDKADKVNYVSKALDEVLAGKSVSTPETKAYGCGVKYPK